MTHAIEQAVIPAGTFLMGESSDLVPARANERPVHEVELSTFRIDVTTVTNADFARFVDDTGHVTDAEHWGSSAVFHLALRGPQDDVIGAVSGAPWWLMVRGADWRHPDGALSGIDERADHPVVHVSWADASAYCAWADRRLPTEAEWEFASRGGQEVARYPWGDAEVDGADWRANIFQGDFPASNTGDDGFLTTAPVRTFSPNGWGLWQCVGNVWEWCADWYDPGYYDVSPRRDPRGPEGGHARVIRGGSYLCHPSYCDRFRNAARSANTPDSSTGNTGFRTVAR
ncbi:formylglycine-generating enzyme required for sulfatase activity [Microbacterium sp. SLBN-154]|uniref:formylglycine-generating enzyme family protein n=1 Tax=Microbacterium sp. SLBN-154 TaxID=2768458 RepID=UPI0011707295|nr:formylglycine-generating enzyme family protein [Microbacterium sp. SLBN-154]TQK18666.1 formylglycine-generating enzyme required for sulfatase activity [Microbacterium sp. SLBN-154]